MQVTTTISLPKNLAEEMEKQISKGNFTSRSEFVRSAVRNYLLLQNGELSWEILAAPFRFHAQKANFSEDDLLAAVEKGRKHDKRPKNSK